MVVYLTSLLPLIFALLVEASSNRVWRLLPSQQGVHSKKEALASFLFAAQSPLAPRVRRDIARPRASKFRMVDEGAELTKWKPGSVDMLSPIGQKAAYLLETEPVLFEQDVEDALAQLAKQVELEELQDEAVDVSSPPDSMSLALQTRIGEIKRQERDRVVQDLLHLMVCSWFRKWNVALVPSMKEGGVVKFGNGDIDGLANAIYTTEALQLVKEHLLSALGPIGTPLPGFMGTQIVQMPLIKASQVYVMSAFFGYYVRQVDTRWQLEKALLSLNDEEKNFGLDEPTATSLKEYIEGFGPKNMQEIIVSREARAVMERQISALFGDVKEMTEKIREAIGLVTSEKEAEEKVQQCIMNGEIETIRISAFDLQRMVLEAVAYGSILYAEEQKVASQYALTAADFTDDGDSSGGASIQGVR